MGDNGAGKSTLVKMIAGNFLPSAGTMKMDGSEIVLHRPVEARRHGIEIVHQDLALCDNLTAAAGETSFLGRGSSCGKGRSSMLDYQGMYERRRRTVPVSSSPETRPRDLSSGRCRAASGEETVAIARTMLSRRPRSF